MQALKDNISLLDMDLTANLIGVAETIHVRGATQISMTDGEICKFSRPSP